MPNELYMRICELRGWATVGQPSGKPRPTESCRGGKGGRVQSPSGSPRSTLAVLCWGGDRDLPHPPLWTAALRSSTRWRSTEKDHSVGPLRSITGLLADQAPVGGPPSPPHLDEAGEGWERAVVEG
jgi:hypothetical protein